jgi:peptidoglycan/LPS O-acetylase OafA/YrhL
VLEWRPLAMLGIASYSLYVLHVPIVNKLAGTSLASFGAAGLLRFALVAVPLCCAVALISYAIIERPFLRLRRRWVGPAPVSPEPVIATPPSPASPAIQAQATP